MKRWSRVFWCVLCVVAAVSCTRTVYVPAETHYSERIVWHDTIVEVVAPGERLERATFDTVSSLQARYASSVAKVVDGVLSHTLTVNPRCDSVQVQVREVLRRDSVVLPYPVVTTVERTPRGVWWVVAWAVIATIATITLLGKMWLRK